MPKNTNVLPHIIIIIIIIIIIRNLCLGPSTTKSATDHNIKVNFTALPVPSLSVLAQCSARPFLVCLLNNGVATQMEANDVIQVKLRRYDALLNYR
jgi:hypothetical protein